MPPIINAQKISKALGAKPLFQDISFTVSEGDRIGLIGPNSSGKSTLLRILAGSEEPESRDLAVRKACDLANLSKGPTTSKTRNPGVTVFVVPHSGMHSWKVTDLKPACRGNVRTATRP